MWVEKDIPESYPQVGKLTLLFRCVLHLARSHEYFHYDRAKRTRYWEKRIRTLIKEGKLHRVHRGIYVDVYDPKDVARALQREMKNLVLTGKSAIELRNMKALTFPLRFEGPRTIQGKDFQVTHGRYRAFEMLDGLRVVKPLWAVRQDGDDSWRTGDFLSKQYRGYKGLQKFDKDLRELGRVPKWLKNKIHHPSIGADSVDEKDLATELRFRGMHFKHNQMVAGYRFDLMLDDVLVEVDSHKYHSTERQFIIDRFKGNAAVLHGYKLLRFNYYCIKENLEEVLDSIEYAVRGGKEPLTYTTPVWKWHPVISSDLWRSP